MGSILNFVFLKNTYEYNGDESYAMQGPIFNYIQSKNYSYTINSEIKIGYRNILLIEGNQKFQTLLNIPDSVYDFIKNNDVKLLFTSIPDPCNISSFIEGFEYIKTKLSSNKYHLIDSNRRLEGILSFDFFLEESTWNRNQYFRDTNNDLGYISKEIQLNELETYRHKKFICFNRALDKEHRISLLNEYLTGNYSDSYFTFLLKTEGYARIYGTEHDNDKKEQIDIDFFNSKLPIELDTHKILDKCNFRVNDTFKKELFLDSCINLVTESSFEQNELFVSEKILKPILNYQPFIVFAGYGYLKHLKTYGFKTFSDFWDESYDDIENSQERFFTLLQLVRKLNEKSIIELNELYKNLKDICIYNREIWNKLEINSLDKILKNIENEW
jgi:hypothetical protein